MGRKVIDRTGMRFGKLTVLKFLETRASQSYWVCRCDCGTILSMSASRLRQTISCGCARSTSQAAAWVRRREKDKAARRKEEDRLREERRHKEWIERQMIRNQKAGLRFDDFWMFGGHDPAGWWRRMTR